jgi:hypothetical protein
MANMTRRNSPKKSAVAAAPQAAAQSTLDSSTSPRIAVPSKSAPSQTASIQTAPGQAAPDQAATPAIWKPWYSWLLLTSLVLAALLPFINRAYHIDDTLFMLAAKNIVHHPLNPYGFTVNWDDFASPMSQVTKNPPLACYYIAVVGALAGWSERAVHLAFLLPALATVLLTFVLAGRFTKLPLVAALATFAAPAFLVSAASVMCDTLLAAIWLLAVVLWLEGFDEKKPLPLALSAMLIGAAAFTKYFGMSLIPLLLAYSLYRERRLGRWIFYLLIPVGMLVAYQVWTKSLYGQGLLLGAAQFANSQQERSSVAAESIEGLSFLGGCMLPAIAFAPRLWSRGQMLIGLLGSAMGAVLILTGVVFTGRQTEGAAVGVEAFHAHPVLFILELSLFIAGGISALGLSISDFLRNRSANSFFLILWLLGGFAFTCYFNWTVNARSILPIVPAVAILIARRMASSRSAQGSQLGFAPFPLRLAAPLLLSAAVALWVLIGDSQLANSARAAAYRTQELTRSQPATVWFIGHWGLQYYMQELGARPADRARPEMAAGDYILIPENNTNSGVTLRPGLPSTELEFPGPSGAISINRKVGAGFYSSFWGPLPFFLGPIPPERYSLVHLVPQPAGK